MSSVLTNDLRNPDVFNTHFENLRVQLSNNHRPKENPFPIDVFPKPMQDIILEANASLKYPIDFMAAAMLYAASLAIGLSCRLQVKETWYAFSVLYMVLVGSPGTNKSHPLSFAVKPIQDREAEFYESFLKEIEAYDEYMSLTEKDKKDKKELGEEVKEPVAKRLLVADATPEALTHILFHNQRGIGLLMDEILGWIKNFSRYNNGSVMEMWLTFWSSKSFSIDRKTDGYRRITVPFISVAGTIQTALLNELAKDNKNLNGFLDRILFVYPDLQKEPWSELDLDKRHIQTWQRIINNLLSKECHFDKKGFPEPRTYRFSLEAWQLIKNWQKDNTLLCNELGNDALSGIYTKLEEYCIRFSLVLQLLNIACGHYDNGEISVEATRGAIRLTEYFRISATKVHDITSNVSPLDKYSKSHKSLYKKLADRFKTKDAIATGKALKLSDRAVYRFLNDKNLFIRVRQGYYEKV